MEKQKKENEKKEQWWWREEERKKKDRMKREELFRQEQACDGMGPSVNWKSRGRGRIVVESQLWQDKSPERYGLSLVIL